VTEDGSPPERRTKACYVGMPAASILDHVATLLWQAFPEAIGLFIVGSSLQRPDWRDVDLRMMLPDQEFEKLFGDANYASQHPQRMLAGDRKSVV